MNSTLQKAPLVRVLSQRRKGKRCTGRDPRPVRSETRAQAVHLAIENGTPAPMT